MAFRGWISRDAPIAVAGPTATYHGGMRLGLASWTYPLVRLTLYHEGLEVGPAAPFLKILVPFWRALYEEIETVTVLTRGRFGGVRFTTRNGASVIFGCFKLQPLIQNLQELTVAVDPVPKRFRSFNPRA